MRPVFLLPLIIAALAVLIAVPDSASAQNRRRQRGGRGSNDSSRSGELKAGQMAPDFTLKYLKTDKKKKVAESTGTKAGSKADKSKTKKKDDRVKLSSFRGKKPVVLLFGSYT